MEDDDGEEGEEEKEEKGGKNLRKQRRRQYAVVSANKVKLMRLDTDAAHIVGMLSAGDPFMLFVQVGAERRCVCICCVIL